MTFTEFSRERGSPWSRLEGAINHRLDKEAFWNKYFTGPFKFEMLLTCPFPDHPDNSPSFKVHRDGWYKCFGCGRKGASPLHFWTEFNGHSKMNLSLVRKFYHENIGPLILDDAIDRYKNRLQSMTDLLGHMEKEWRITAAVLDHFNIGWCNKKEVLTVPLYDHNATVPTMIMYNILKKEDKPDQWYYQKKMVQGLVWPISILESSDTVFMMEGYKDCMVALSLGLPAMTIGSSSYSIQPPVLSYFQGKTVYFLYDPDLPGRKGALKNAEILLLHGVTKKVKIIEVPGKKKRGDEKAPDFTDWAVKDGIGKADVEKLCIDTDWFKMDRPVMLASGVVVSEEGEKDAPPFVPLSRIRDDEWHEKYYRTEGTVVGKDDIPIKFPKVLRVSCRSFKKKCIESGCPCSKNHLHNHSIRFQKTDPRLIRFAEQSDMGVNRVAKDILGISNTCSVSCDMLETYTATNTLFSLPLQATSQEKGRETSPTHVVSYFFKSDILVNTTYLLRGYTTNHPSNSRSMGVFVEGDPIASSIEAYEVTQSRIDLMEGFRAPDADVYSHLMRFYKRLQESVTPIRGRATMIMAMDLALHSPCTFVFNEEHVSKGALDVLVFGDTGCGKTRAAQALLDYYEHGEVISGENTTLVGLQGGIKTATNFRGPAWGRLAMNHRSSVVIDEMTGLAPEIISNLSRIRNDGVAEICKDATISRANACTSIIWLSNTREGRPLRKYNFGVDPLRTLVAKAEDIRRFDYVHAVCDDDVDPSDILSSRTNGHKFFSKEQCHELILWAKSRQTAQIEFTPEATRHILGTALTMHKEYNTRIPLILPTTLHIKLAKISAAIAARVFASDQKGEKIVVDTCHAFAAIKFLESLYKSESLGYFHYSLREFDKEDLDVSMAETLITDYADKAEQSEESFLKFWLSHNQITNQDLQDYLCSDHQAARYAMSEFTRAKAIERKYQHYIKNHRFTTFVRRKLKEGH